MPHECTDCGRVFEDGSTEMLSGCPDCGGTTFQFRPDGEGSSTESAEPPETPDPDIDRVTRTVGTAASVVRDLVGDSPPEAEPESNPERKTSRAADTDTSPDVGEDHTDAGDERENTGKDQTNVGEDSGEDHTDAGDEREDTDKDHTDAGEDADTTKERVDTGEDHTDAAESTGEASGGGETTAGGSNRLEAGEASAEWPGEDGFRTAADDDSSATTTNAEDETPPREDERTTDSEGEATTTPEGEARSGGDGDIVEADDPPEATGTGDRPPVPDPRPLSMRADEAQESTDEEGPEDGTVATGEDRPSLSELRAELNDQFESIRVRAPGQYELNLMELYDREEYIIALQEDGKYTVQLPERWDER